MKLLPDWRLAWSQVRARLLPDVEDILKRAWSLRLIELAFAADLILNLVPVVSDYLPWWLTLLLLVGAYVARLLVQPDPASEAAGVDKEKETTNANQ
ncbi:MULTISPECIES: hypothetical protein [unclassified Sinorhizobium]|uniref:DUF7940 domain-containing protein n=1 Tax=unclassified Sinorhizobium TaxID=2613772 RepID=UPI003523206B